MSKRTRLISAGLAAVIALAAAGWFLVVPRLEQDAAETFGRGDYVLQATDGTTFTEDTLKGAPSIVYFGFGHCPDVCPTTMGDILTWNEELAQEGQALRAFFITVDPERDTLEMLGDYVSWVPDLVGVTGSREEIDKAIKAFRIYAAKGPVDEDGDYFMDHSSTVLLFDRKGRLFEPIGYQEDHDRAMDKLHRLLAG